jgi:lactate dehydrogenase-like 2-hydroxyacid dehydrogenase
VTKPDILQMGPPESQRLPELLAEEFTVHRYWEAADKAALLDGLADRLRYIATVGHQGPDAAVIEALPKLELIASFGVGYNGIDIDAARKRGVRVTNTPDVLNDCVAELTVGLMLALVRDLVQADRYTREGRWASEGPYPLRDELTGKTVGILGLGRIGKEIARRLQVFRMQVVYHGRRQQPDEPYPYYADLAEMARAVDWLVVIAPGTPETRHIVNATTFEALGPEGRLVNVGRGMLVDEAALVDALKAERIKGAALDVFEDEPNPDPRLLDLRNVVLVPHVGSATTRTRTAMAELVMVNLRAHLRGESLKSPVV